MTLQLALSLQPPPRRILAIASQDLAGLENCLPAVQREHPDVVGVRWLFGGDGPPPAALRDRIVGRRVLNALGDAAHARLLDLRAGSVLTFDPRPAPGSDLHVLAQWRSALASRAALFAHAPQPLQVDAALRAAGRDALSSRGGAAAPVLIHPGSGGRAKCWPLPCWLGLAEALAAHGLAACLLLGPTELEWFSAAQLAALRALPIPRLESPPAEALSAVLSATAAVVSNDSGIAHFAALLGVPVVAVFGPTSPAVWRPVGSRVRVVRGDIRRADDWGLSADTILAALADLPRA